MEKKFISLKHTFINSAGTFLSRITGILKQIVVNYLFGISADPFWAAFRIANTLRRYIGEGAMSTAFIPVFQKIYTEKGKDEAFKFSSNIFNLFFIITFIITFFGIILSPYYYPFLVTGFKKGSIELIQSINLNMIIMPFTIFISLFAIGMGILNSLKKFLSPSIAPVFFNIIFILIPLLFHKQLNIYSIGIATVVGGVSMFLCVMIELIYIKYKYSFYFNLKDSNLKPFFNLFIPTSLNMLVLTFKNLVTTQFMTYFKGALTVCINAFIIIEAPLGIIGVAIGTVLMPVISKFKAEKNMENFYKSLNEAFNMMIYFMLPTSIYFIFFSDTIVNVILRDIMLILTGNTGRYTEPLLKNTYLAVSLYSISLLSMGFIILYERVFYALEKGKVPLFANILTFIISFLLYFTSFIPDVDFKGIVLADSIASWIVLFYYFLKLKDTEGKDSNFIPFLKYTSKVCIITIISTVIIYFYHKFIYIKISNYIIMFLMGITEIVLFGIIYYILSKIFRIGIRK